MSIDVPEERPTEQADGLTIRVSAGVGSGETRLAAFDAALHDAGVAGYNLVRLSSVVPVGSQVQEVGGAAQLRGDFGDLLYCVCADAYAVSPGQSVTAGMAWCQATDGSGRGMFVEHTGRSRSFVEHELRLSLADLMKHHSHITSAGDFVEKGLRVATATWIDRPACAVVIAAYAVRGWGGFGTR